MTKYRAKPTVIDGIRFASKAEASRHAVLKMLEGAKLIRDLRLQVPFPVIINGVRVGKYVADFVYFEITKRGGLHTEREIIEDVKGHPTALYKFKKRCVEAQYGIRITEVRA